MKKITALLLVCVMVFSLAACNKTPAPTNPTEEPSATEPSVDVNATPEVNLALRDVTFTAADGTELADKIMVSPLSADKYNPDAAMEELKKLDFLKNWYPEVKYAETARPIFTENGQLNAFTTGTMLVFYSVNPDAEGIGHCITVTYNKDTDAVDGYSAVVVGVNYGPHDPGKPTDEQMLQVLKVVHGDQYANFLFNGDMKKDGEIEMHEITQDIAFMEFIRSKSDAGMEYVARCGLTDDPVEGYVGDFEPTLDQVAYVNGLLHLTEGEDTPLDLNNFAKSFLEKHYGEGTHFVMGDSILSLITGLYAYQDDGMYKQMMMQYDIAVKDAPADERYCANMIISVDPEKTETFFSFDIGYLNKEDVNDASREALRQKALDMIKDILGVENIDMVDALFLDNHYRAMQLNGQDIAIGFNFHCTPDEEGNEQATLTFSTSTDLRYVSPTEPDVGP